MKAWGIVLFCWIIGTGAVLIAGGKIEPRLQSSLQSLSSTDRILAWIFFADKGTHEVLKSSVPQNVVSPKSFQRRLKSRPFESAVDYTDLPIERSYADQIAARGLIVRQVSKWFNGVSVNATRNQIEQIESLPFVARIELLARFKRNRTEEVQTEEPAQSQTQTLDRQTNLDYGLSFNQLNQINVPAVHATGNYGQGVIVGSFDNGVRLLNHEAFDSLRTRIVATYDFVDHKVSVAPNNPGTGFGAHGVATLSTLAGYKPGQLIGPAFGARFILARTENDSSETPLEEDNWVAAIEWAESLGVDVTSTSLGYLTYDAPFASWTWQNMDGNTTVITRAADMAVSKGVVVVNSAGNSGFNATHNTLNAPADGDSVLTIGALTIDGERTGFSSVGPTLSNPPRIKPDVMAQGITVRSAATNNPTGYAYAQGTSLSCPLAAGVAALVIHANPTARAVEIMNAMRNTASRAGSPDREYGWGIINALNAVNLVGAQRIPTTYRLLQNYPNPFNPLTRISFELPKISFVSLKVYDLLGQEVKTLINNQQYIGIPSIIWRGDNNEGSKVATGVYFARLAAKSVDGTSSFSSTIKLVFLQ